VPVIRCMGADSFAKTRCKTTDVNNDVNNDAKEQQKTPSRTKHVYVDEHVPRYTRNDNSLRCDEFYLFSDIFNATPDIAMRKLSVCLSVCQTRQTSN